MLALELAGRSGPRLPARDACADVLARARASQLARAAQASPDDAVAHARVSRRRAVPGARHARRRSAGPVVADRLPPPRRGWARPAGCDRRALLPHESLRELLLPA